MEMMLDNRYNPSDIAGWFLANTDRDAGDSITHLKLQKLLYYAQAWALVLLDRSLFEEDFQAWAHGPVVESIFHKYKEHSWNALPCTDVRVSIDEETDGHLAEIMNVYGDFSAKHLERITHGELPWREARGDLPPETRSNAIISKEVMKKYYNELYKRVKDGEKGQGA